jgi:hypothetical protein
VALSPLTTPAIPQPFADLYSLTAVAQALKQRVENIAGYTAKLSIPSGGTSGGATAYTLPTASTTTLGGVKVDGVTVTVTSGVLSAVVPEPAVVAPVMDGVAAVGSSPRFARSDHVHPHDTANPAGYLNAGEVALAIAHASYRLPAASTTVRGGIKVDGTTVVMSGDVLSAVGGGVELMVNGDIPVGIICDPDGVPVYAPV